MFYKIKRNDSEIDEVLNWAAEAEEIGSNYPGMSFEQGVTAMFDWLTGATDVRPDTD